MEGEDDWGDEDSEEEPHSINPIRENPTNPIRENPINPIRENPIEQPKSATSGMAPEAEVTMGALSICEATSSASVKESSDATVPSACIEDAEDNVSIDIGEYNFLKSLKCFNIEKRFKSNYL